MDERQASGREAWEGELFRLLVENVRDYAIFIVDPGGLVRSWSAGARHLLGYDEGEILGRSADLFFTPEDVRDGAPGDERRQALETGRGDDDRWHVRKDGSWFWSSGVLTPLWDEAGALRGFAKIMRDRTDWMRRQEALIERERLDAFGREVGLALARGGALREMLGRVAGAIVRDLGAVLARVWTADDAGAALELQASAGMYTHLDGAHARVPVGAYEIGRIARDRAPHLTNAVVGDPQVHDQDWARREGLVAFAGYPLVAGDRLVGVVAVFARHALTAAALQMLASVANELAVGIERVQAGERLHRHREWLRVTLDSIGDGVIATGVDGRVTFLNAVAEGLTGWPRAEAVGVPLGEVFRVVNEETRAAVGDLSARALREGRVVGLANHSVLIARDGTERAVADSAAPIRDEGGAVMGAVVVFRDVDEERRAARALEASEARKAAILESALDAVVTMDHTGRVVDWNPAAERIFGHARSDAVGRDLADLIVPPALREQHRQGLARHLATGEGAFVGQRVEVPAVRADGTEFPAELAVTRIRGGGLPLFTAHVRDITDRIRGEQELLAAKEEAEAANQAKTQFLAVLSHELRTPLNPILLAASSMLERPADPGELRPTLQMIRQNVLLQARLIDDLLDVMRIVRGKMPLHWEVADCHRLIDQAVQICRSEVFGKTLRLETDLAAGRRLVNADPARLQQVFWNLIKNAVKFTPEGGAIAIRTRNVHEPDERIVVEVSDTGIGIEPDVLPRIFDPFQQGETTITRKFGGLGLGLAICKGIVDAHGGTLTAESAGKDRGTTFRVVLKALPNPSADGDVGVGVGGERGASASAGAPADAQAHPPALRILVVEDEPATLRLMARLLRGLGHEVTTAATIAAAAAAVEAGAFDLIISDIGLPDGSGLELMRRAVALKGPVPAIALTGYGMEEDIRRSREAGFTAHLTKPIDFAKLEAMIRQVAPTRA